MTILVLNGSPRKNGSVAKLLEKEVERFSKKGNPEIIQIQDCAESSSCRNEKTVKMKKRSEEVVEVLKEKYPELKK